AAIPRVVGPHAQLAGHPNRSALVQIQIAQRLGTLAEQLHPNPVGPLVVAVAVAHAYAGVPDGGAVVRVLHLRRVAEASGEAVAVEVAHAAFSLFARSLAFFRAVRALLLSRVHSAIFSSVSSCCEI